MEISLFDTPNARQSLLPFTYTKAIADLRIGVYSIKEKWAHYLSHNISILTADYLAEKYGSQSSSIENLYINATILPDEAIVAQIKSLSNEQALLYNDELVAFKSKKTIPSIDAIEQLRFEHNIVIKSCTQLSKPWHIFQQNGSEIKKDVLLLDKNQLTSIDDVHTKVYYEENLYIEEGAEIKAAILDASNGPIYIGKNAKINIGTMLVGPVSIGEETQISLGAKIKGDTSIGPHCRVGGEVSNSVIQGYSNKGHDGFLGNAVIGEWCNLGADTNASNLKNNYSDVKAWNYATQSFESIGGQFCGLLMGDHSKTGINTMFNTATTVGICSNIFGADFPPKFIPSFSWGAAGNFEEFKLDKVIEMAKNMMVRRNVPFDQKDEKILSFLFDKTKRYRS